MIYLFSKSWWRKNYGIPVYYVDAIGTQYSSRLIWSDRDGPMIDARVKWAKWRWITVNCDGTCDWINLEHKYIRTQYIKKWWFKNPKITAEYMHG